jgi:glycosyltransferase involved in cell wall biosynthesis
MFSVIIPLFNKSAYIERCLQSVINQTWQDFEVIVVNDGSTDKGPEKLKSTISELTKEKAKQLVDEETERLIERTNDQPNEKTASKDSICINYKTRKLDFRVINQENLGVSTARNNGVNLARFDYIAFLDADDWWESTYLEEMQKLIEEFPGKGIYGCSYYIFKNGKKKISKIGIDPGFRKGEIDYFEVYAKTLCMPIWTGATIVPRSIFNSESGFRTNLSLGEDFDLWIRIALKHPVSLLNKPLSNYNQDVELPFRAVGKLHNPQNHVLWNLDYLDQELANRTDLKKLIDRLRIYGLFPYYLDRRYRNSAILELKKIDWTPYYKKYFNKYNIPIPLLAGLNKFRKAGSVVKQYMLRTIYTFWFKTTIHLKNVYGQ